MALQSLTARVRKDLGAWRVRRRARALEGAIDRPVRVVAGTDPGAPQRALQERIRARLPAGDARYSMRDVSLAGALGERLGASWARFGADYTMYGGSAREKALEHALGFELLDFARVARYCDVASDASRVKRMCAALYPGVEVFVQDLQYESDLSRRVIGGFAQRMQGVEAGFFDALTLHCSYEHFAGRADEEFVAEVDRVLSPRGACLIVPLYVGDRHRIFFNPARVSGELLAGYDAEAELCASSTYTEEHGRYYSPESLWTRVLARLPPGLHATILSFEQQKSVDESVYVRFGLVLHRPQSILVLPTASAGAR